VNVATCIKVNFNGSGGVIGTPVRVVQGTDVTVNVTMQAPVAVGAWQIDVPYDPALLTPRSCTPGQGIGNALCNIAPGGAPNRVRVLGSSTDGVNGSVTLASIVFRGMGSSTLPVSGNLTFTVTTLTNPEGGSLGHVTTDSPVRVLPRRPDANQDGTTNAVDALCILRALGNFSSTTACPQPLPYPDINGDGAVTAVDSLCILRDVGGFAPTANCPQSQANVTPASFTAAAALLGTPAAPLRLRPESATLATGGTLGVRIELDPPAGGLGAWTVDVAYDPALLKPVDCTTDTGGAGALCNRAPAGLSGIVRLLGSAAPGLSGSLTLGRITFEALSAGTPTLKAAPATLADGQGAPFSATPTSATITIAPAAARP